MLDARNKYGEITPAIDCTVGDNNDPFTCPRCGRLVTLAAAGSQPDGEINIPRAHFRHLPTVGAGPECR